MSVRIMVSLISSFFIFLATLRTEAKETPNIVIILADDLGYGDVQCYNRERGKIPTPNIDRLAAEGMRFTDGHSSSGVCSPSRYALLTGRYHWRTKLQNGIVGTWGAPLIAPDRLTIASLAKTQGYRTACIGKWHLGWDWPIAPEDAAHFTFNGFDPPGEARIAAWRKTFAQPIPGGPTTRGFDRYFGTDVPNWPPYCFIENDRTLGIPTTVLPQAALVKNQASKQGPALADWKLEPILPALAERAEKFIAEAAAEAKPFLLYLPLTTPHTPLAVNDAWKGKSGLRSDFADLVMETDFVVGRITAKLAECGLERNTLVFFSADNGCASYIGVEQLEKQGHYPSGPLRGYKADFWEGGHRVPFILRWPAKTKAGAVCERLVHQADLMATLAEIWNVPLPEDAGEDSFSLMPHLRGEDRPVREHAVSCAASGIPAFRLGSWKYIPTGDDASGSAVRLYDLATDLGEKKNLAGEHPQRVAEMQTQLEHIISRGRSTPGPEQKNDVTVRRYPQPVSAGEKKNAKAKRK